MRRVEVLEGLGLREISGETLEGRLVVAKVEGFGRGDGLKGTS